MAQLVQDSLHRSRQRNRAQCVRETDAIYRAVSIWSVFRSANIVVTHGRIGKVGVIERSGVVGKGVRLTCAQRRRMEYAQGSICLFNREMGSVRIGKLRDHQRM